MAKPSALTPALAAKILAKLRDGVPFIALAAEACGVNRGTMHWWMHEGDAGKEPFAEFAAQVRQIRAEYMNKLMQECMQADKNTGEAARQKAWILQRLDREIFDPPRQVEERKSEGRGPDKQPRQPQKAPDHPDVAKAADTLANPEPDTPVTH